MSEKRFKLKISSFSDDHMKFMNVEYNGKRIKLEEIVDLLNEQQSIIQSLQDLCGESDGENAKLRIENKRLQEENEQLKADEKLYAQEILRLKKELKENQALKLGNDY